MKSNYINFTNCTIEEAEKIFKAIETYGFKKDLKSSEDNRRVYYYYGRSYCIFYRKGVFSIITKVLQERILDEGHLKSFLYYIHSSEKPYLRKFLRGYDAILEEINLQTYDVKAKMTEQLNKYENNIKYLPYKNTLKIKARDRIIKILREIDDLKL